MIAIMPRCAPLENGVPAGREGAAPTAAGHRNRGPTDPRANQIMRPPNEALQMKLLRLAFAGLIITVAGLQFAAAAEWRFCIATGQSRAQNLHDGAVPRDHPDGGDGKRLSSGARLVRAAVTTASNAPPAPMSRRSAPCASTRTISTGRWAPRSSRSTGGRPGAVESAAPPNLGRGAPAPQPLVSRVKSIAVFS